MGLCMSSCTEENETPQKKNCKTKVRKSHCLPLLADSKRGAQWGLERAEEERTHLQAYFGYNPPLWPWGSYNQAMPPAQEPSKVPLKDLLYPDEALDLFSSEEEDTEEEDWYVLTVYDTPVTGRLGVCTLRHRGLDDEKSWQMMTSLGSDVMTLGNALYLGTVLFISVFPSTRL
ncbi:hypothetical protein UPYG_G00207490 [Umbra pygmaea]|uniref:Uncharacterized protein n=1 Tax=Umbra pygmaea TaxID=75934 RepID=A0ABD0WKX5_UMBPY